MTHISRRSFVLTAATAGAAFGLDKAIEIIPSAHAQQGASPTTLNPKGLKFHRFKVGDIEVTQVLDATIERDHNPTFVKNASVDDVKTPLKTAGLADEKVPNAYTVTIVKLGDRQIMFDSGNGLATGNPNFGHLAENAKAAGIDLSKLSAIIVTHFHPDHIYGLLTKENAQVYANTPVIVPEAEYKYWADPATIAALPEARQGIPKRVQATMPTWKNLTQHAGDKEVVPGVRAIPTHGHTPGHTSYHVASGSQQLIVLGDVTNIPAFNVRNPGWHLIVDQDAAIAEASRRRTFDRAVADKIMLTGYHWGMPGAGTLAKDGNGYVLTAVTT